MFCQSKSNVWSNKRKLSSSRLKSSSCGPPRASVGNKRPPCASVRQRRLHYICSAAFSVFSLASSPAHSILRVLLNYPRFALIGKSWREVASIVRNGLPRRLAKTGGFRYNQEPEVRVNEDKSDSHHATGNWRSCRRGLWAARTDR